MLLNQVALSEQYNAFASLIKVSLLPEDEAETPICLADWPRRSAEEHSILFLFVILGRHLHVLVISLNLELDCQLI